jgi:hypothetical protein
MQLNAGPALFGTRQKTECQVLRFPSTSRAFRALKHKHDRRARSLHQQSQIFTTSVKLYFYEGMGARKPLLDRTPTNLHDSLPGAAGRRIHLLSASPQEIDFDSSSQRSANVLVTLWRLMLCRDAVLPYRRRFGHEM